MLNLLRIFRTMRVNLKKDFTFEEEHIVIPITTVPNDVVIPLQHENIVVLLQGTDIVYPKVDPANEVEPKNL